MVVVELHLASLIGAFFEAIVGICARSSRWDEKAIWLAIIDGGRVIAMVVHS